MDRFEQERVGVEDVHLRTRLDHELAIGSLDHHAIDPVSEHVVELGSGAIEFLAVEPQHERVLPEALKAILHRHELQKVAASLHGSRVTIDGTVHDLKALRLNLARRHLHRAERTSPRVHHGVATRDLRDDRPLADDEQVPRRHVRPIHRSPIGAYERIGRDDDAFATDLPPACEIDEQIVVAESEARTVGRTQVRQVQVPFAVGVRVHEQILGRR